MDLSSTQQNEGPKTPTEDVNLNSQTRNVEELSKILSTPACPNLNEVLNDESNKEGEQG